MMNKKVAVLGATGYVGARLVPRLLERGYRVNATSRNQTKLLNKPFAGHPDVELLETDVQDSESLRRALDGCRQAFYFVHSMNAQSRDFSQADRQAAANMVEAARAAGVEQIIYLGGLGEDSPDLSRHLRSRYEVGQILQEGEVPVTTLRAAMIIGSGSASFEILRYLVDRLPVMITPRWVSVPTQPIAIKNALNYLIGCLEEEATIGKVLDTGGPEIVTYRDLMTIYAEEAGLDKRLIVPVPVFTPRLSSHWIHLVTPVPAYLGRPLAEGLRNPTICTDHEIETIIPQELLTCREAMRLALDRTQHHRVESHWTDAGKIWPVAWSSSSDPEWAGGTIYEDSREIVLDASPQEIWKPIVRIGGTTGYYYGDWLWRLRGIMDKLFGGVGLRRGRRDPERIYPGDVLDFWRVKHVEPDRHLILVAEMKLPGEAVLEFVIEPREDGRTALRQTAKFLPHGLMGIAYWHMVMPLHDIVFDGMLRGIANTIRSGGCSAPKKLQQAH